jgi:hypothetical protein
VNTGYVKNAYILSLLANWFYGAKPISRYYYRENNNNKLLYPQFRDSVDTLEDGYNTKEDINTYGNLRNRLKDADWNCGIIIKFLRNRFW